MRNSPQAFRFVALVVCLAIAGCARAYHDYANGCVNCTYCPHPPLPYTTYRFGCGESTTEFLPAKEDASTVR
jgi:hypothetical protein